MLLAGGVTAVVAVAVTAMWAAENMGSKAMFKEEKKERGRKNERGKKASQMKPKKEAQAPQDAPAQRAAPPPAAPPPALKAAAPAPAAAVKEQGKKKSKKGGKEEAAAPAPAAAPGKKKKANKAEAPSAQAGDEKKEKEKEKKKKDRAAQMQADADDGWCQVGKSGKPKEESGMASAAPADAVADTSMFMGVADNSAAFFEVPVGAGGDFLQTSVAPTTTSDLGEVASAQAGKKKDKKKGGPVVDTGSNGWSPSTDEVATTVARDASMTIAPSPAKQVVTEGDEWATVPVKTKKKSSKT